jgi:hypothetical protein
LQQKPRFLFICIFSIRRRSIRFFISRFYKFLQSLIKCFMMWSTSSNFTHSYQFTATLQKIYISPRESIILKLISLLKWVMYFAGCVYQPCFGGAIWSDTYWGTSLKGIFIWWVLLHKTKGTWDFIATIFSHSILPEKHFNISSIALLIRLLLLLYGV